MSHKGLANRRDGRASETRQKTRKAKMEIINEEVTRGIRTANFVSVREFGGRLVRGKLDIQTAVSHGTCMVQFVVHYVVPATQTALRPHFFERKRTNYTVIARGHIFSLSWAI
jgi:hypothetical protein